MGAEFTDLTDEELCDLMCGGPEVDADDVSAEVFTRADDAKPCPFCGNEIILFRDYVRHAGKRVSIMCPKCMVTVETGMWQEQSEALEVWNTRA